VARRAIAGAVMLASLASLAAKPVDAEKSASATGPAPDPPQVDPQIVDLTARLVDAEKALSNAHESYERQLAEAATENTSLRARVEELELTIATERDSAQKRIDDLRADFDAAWERRERALGGDKPSPSAPVRGQLRRFAAALIHCHDGAGAKLAIRAHEPIPEDADLTGVHPSAIEER